MLSSRRNWRWNRHCRWWIVWIWLHNRRQDEFGAGFCSRHNHYPHSIIFLNDFGSCRIQLRSWCTLFSSPVVTFWPLTFGGNRDKVTNSPRRGRASRRWNVNIWGRKARKRPVDFPLKADLLGCRLDTLVYFQSNSPSFCPVLYVAVG